MKSRKPEKTCYPQLTTNHKTLPDVAIILAGMTRHTLFVIKWLI